MATVSEHIALDLIKRNGKYEDDPRCSKIVTYFSPEGQKNWAVVYPHEDQMRYERSPWCRNVEVIWEAK